MSFSVAAADERVQSVEFNEEAMSVRLQDGRVISVPIAWYPRLLHATPTQRKNWNIAGAGYGIHWPAVDEDISTAGLLRGAAAPIVRESHTRSLGSVNLSNLPSSESWSSTPRPVQSALDAAGIDAFEQTA